MSTIFEKIINNEIPAEKLHEDDICVVILDINPVNKGHALIINRKPYPTFTQCPQNELSHMMEIAKKVDQLQRSVLKCEGTNIIINNSPAANQEIPHLHIHVIPRYSNDGQTLKLDHKVYKDNELKEFKEKLQF
ncbi:MAG: HIT family protein [Sphaerochaetaceae bacterium]|nr:HIT family protein [Sphaerochaetaceae bacterium]